MIIIVFLLFSLFCGSAAAAVTKGTVTNLTGTPSSTSHTISYTNPGGTNNAFFLRLHTTGNDITAVTYNADPLTFIIAEDNMPAGAVWIEWWYIVNPDAGTNNFVISIPTNAEVRVSVYPCTGVKQTATILDSDSVSTSNAVTASLTLDGVTDGLVLDGMSQESPASGQTAGAGQTQDTGTTTTPTLDTLGSSEPGGGTVTMSWSGLGAFQDWAHAAISIAPFTVTVTAFPTSYYTQMMNQ